MEEIIRCPWAEKSDLDRDYHDREWGRPLHDEGRLFELLILEGHQAGLSWSTILHKRERYRLVYDGFDPELMARYDDAKRALLLADPGIIRNRLKVEAATLNARAYLRMRESGLTLEGYLWNYVDGRPILNHWEEISQVPAETPLSQQISRDLKKRGFRFVGPTIVYAYLQSAGLADDHLERCVVRKDPDRFR